MAGEPVGIAVDELMPYEGPERPIAAGDYVMTRRESTPPYDGRLLVLELGPRHAYVIPAPKSPYTEEG